MASYPNSTPTDKEAYIALVITIFTQYPMDAVRKAVSPNGIPLEVSKFLPTTGEIEKWLNGEISRIKRLESYKALPPVVFKYSSPKPAEPNLFVPDDVPEFDLVIKFTKDAKPKYYRYEPERICYDGRIAGGYWVPDSWWESRHKSYSEWERNLINNPGVRLWKYSDGEIKKAAPG